MMPTEVIEILQKFVDTANEYAHNFDMRLEIIDYHDDHVVVRLTDMDDDHCPKHEIVRLCDRGVTRVRLKYLPDMPYNCNFLAWSFEGEEKYALISLESDLFRLMYA